MAWPVLTDAASAVELIMCIACVLMGVSHIAQPQMWLFYRAACARHQRRCDKNVCA